MARVTIIQVGDIHFPQLKDIISPLDDKDDKFSPELKHQLTSSQLEIALAKLIELSQLSTLSLIAFMGDITTRGDQPGLASGFWLLSKLVASKASNFDPKVVVVPGNHDVSRPEAAGVSAPERFRAFSAFAQHYGWFPPPVDAAHFLTATAPGIEIPVALVNTSIGSWETHHLPLELELTAKKLETEYYDQLDTPYVPDSVIRNLAEEIKKSHATSPYIIIAHHNIFPQSIPKIAPYSELLNSGRFTSALLSCDSPIIYLHGHTHSSTMTVSSRVRPY